MQMTRISIPVSVEERAALKAHAQAALRHPRDQARYLLRVALGLAEEPAQECRNRNAVEAEAPRATGAEL